MPEATPIKIASYADLLKQEPEILKRIQATPNGGNLFMIHPFMLLEELGIQISDRAKKEIIEAEPSLSGLSPAPYKALRNSKDRQNFQINLKGLFRRRTA